MFGILTGAFGGDMVVSMWKKLPQQQPKGELVSTTVGFRIVLELFWCHITHGASGLFQNSIIVSIGKAEVDDLHVIAVAGDEDVTRLEVAMNDLLAVDV